MEHEPLRDKKQLINSWEYDNAIAEYRECNHGIYTFCADDVKSAIKGLRGEIDSLDIPMDQGFKIIGLFSKWFYDIYSGGRL